MHPEDGHRNVQSKVRVSREGSCTGRHPIKLHKGFVLYIRKAISDYIFSNPCYYTTALKEISRRKSSINRGMNVERGT